MRRAFAEETRDGEFAHGQHELRPQQLDLAFQPSRAFFDLLGRGHAVAAFGALARKTAADGGEINPVAHLVLAPADAPRPENPPSRELITLFPSPKR